MAQGMRLVVALLCAAGCSGPAGSTGTAQPDAGAGAGSTTGASGASGAPATSGANGATRSGASSGSTGGSGSTSGSSGRTGGTVSGSSDAGLVAPSVDASDDAVVVPSGPATGTFPPITDAWQPGPFAVTVVGGGGPSGNATLLYPTQLGQNGLKHPIVVWDNGAGQTGLSIYGALLQHIASHGFAVYAAYSATDQGTELTDGLDWMIKQAGTSGSPFYQKLDTTKTAAMGHSQGGIATFAIAADPRLSTTIHLSGGTNPMIAQGHATEANLHHPAAFMCGQEPTAGQDGLTAGDTASPWCAYDYDHVTVPVFLVQIQGASHITAPGMTLGACAGWLRWQLMGDTTMRAMFAPTPSCSLCTRPNWMVKEKGL